MSILIKWGEARRIYKETQPYKIIPQRIGKLRYWGSVISVIILIISIYLLSVFTVFYSKIPTHILLAVAGILIFSMCFIMWKLEKRIQYQFNDVYKKFNLKSYSFFKRKGFLPYILFKYKADNSNILNKKDINKLNCIPDNKAHSSNIVLPVLVSLITAFIQQTINCFYEEYSEYVTLVTFIIFVLVPLYIIWDTYKTYKSRDAVIYKRLKIWSVDE